MLHKTRPLTLILGLIFLSSTISCLKDKPVEVRTPEMELSEITSAIQNLEKNGYNVDTTAFGVYYVVLKAGTGPFPQYGDVCSLEYDGYFLDGSIFDSSSYSFEDGIWKYNFLEENIISGFEEGISLMQKGTQIYLIIPSDLAYGAGGSGTIPPYTPLLFDVTMVDLQPASN